MKNQCIIAVNNHTYIGDRYYVDKCIKIGKEAMKGKNAIIAIEKGIIVKLLNEQYKTKDELNKAKQDYIDKGFKVYTA